MSVFEPPQSVWVSELKELPPLAARVTSWTEDYGIWCFYGRVGAGKTTFIQVLCRELGVREEVTSPTYSLVNTYTGSGGRTIYHLDLYRLRNLEEAWAMGLEEYLFSGNLCLVEWPELIEPLFNELSVLLVKMEVRDDSRRKILFLNYDG